MMITPFIPSARYHAGYHVGRRVPPSLFAIHYAECQSLDQLVRYFAVDPDQRSADATWCIGQDGRTVQMVQLTDAPWTNGTGCGLWRDYLGRETTLINDIAFAVECTNDNGPDGWPEFTDDHYRALADAHRLVVEAFAHTRLWHVCGHEHLVAGTHNWPGDGLAYKADPGPRFDWRRYLVEFLGIRQDFYDKYLSYLATAAEIHGADLHTVPTPADLARKQSIIREGLALIYHDLLDKPSTVAVQ